ncbi:MAG: HAMP domain-containing histidine kinase [Alphaproteobacteria bacterium]|nr:HAMP domain-containing histidine kinase [Alphaproteobacteria bacterium]
MTRARQLPGLLTGLSVRLLGLTIAFVMLAEFLIYTPSIAKFRTDWLQGRIAAARLVSLALDATPDYMVSDALKAELLAHAEAYAIVIQKPGDVRRVLAGDMPPRADARFDLRGSGMMDMVGPVREAYMTLFGPGTRTLHVVGDSPRRDGVVVEVLVDEARLRQGMIEFSERILALSLVISLITACLVYLSLQWMFVRPLRRLTANMLAFRDAPEDAASVIVPSARSDEIGIAQNGLADMEKALRASLRQKERLVALGVAVAKISHDLRGILSTAQLVSDRLSHSADPEVRRLAPAVIASIDRAIALCSQTLDYAREDLPPPQRSRFALADLVEEVGRVVGLLTAERARWDAAVPPLDVVADRDQLFRVLVNLGRNAAEAGAKTIRVTAAATGGGGVTIEVADDGPGLPAKARDKLFMPFTGSARAGGTGLGLAIARDLARGHGGELTLAATSASGTVFRLDLPGVVAAARAAE